MLLPGARSLPGDVLLSTATSKGGKIAFDFEFHLNSSKYIFVYVRLQWGFVAAPLNKCVAFTG